MALQAGAGLIEGNGTVQAGTLAAQAAGDIVLSGAANQIASVGPVSIAGGLTQAGMVSSSGSVILADSTALLLQNASISGPGAVQLSLAGNLTEAATGTIVSNPGSVTITGGGAASLAGSVSGGFGVSIGFAGSLTEAATGTVMSNAGSVTIIGRDAASLAGSVSGASGVGIEFAGNLTEAATGTVMSKAGSVTITGGGGASLAGSVLGASGVGIGLADNLTEAATGVIASTAGPIVIGSPGTLSFAGTLSAPRIVLGGPALVDDMQLSRLANATATPQRIEWSGGFVMTGSAIPVGPGEPDIKSPISPTAGTLGLFATAASFSQTGQTKIGALPGASAETVEFTLVGQGGLIAFDPSTAAGLFAPGTQLLLDLQAGGRAIGNIDVAGLNLYFGQPPTGNASLTGLVDGRGGSAAAATGFAHQMANTNYRDNGCPVQSLNCVLLSPVVVPLGSPVQNLVVAVAHDQDEDDDLILPNVAEQDY